jgi:4-amino-4-deoxy-L-arabinose transferase-like glycosyltransferase
MQSIAVVIGLVVAAAVLAYFVTYWSWLRGNNDPLSRYCRMSGESADFSLSRYPMCRKDALPLILITLVYGIVAFIALGDNFAPQTFCHFKDTGNYVLIELDEETEISQVMYYSGLKSGDYYLQFSQDNETWVDQTSMPQSHADLFKWQYATLAEGNAPVRYVRIIAGSELYLGELALYDGDGQLISADRLIYDAGCAPLFDEQELIPDEPTYMNSAYFDEIYHARTAYENVTNVYPYEVSHPPLGKLIISVGVRIFGMTPFGWRIMGVIFGILMLPILYVFIKNLFGSTAVSACGTAIFAFDFMHFVQTRIATIDTYAVFFILLSYLFMYRWLTRDTSSPFAKKSTGLGDLAMSGITFGIGCACKWTVIYAGAGLGVLWLLGHITYIIGRVKSGRGKGVFGSLVRNILFCIAFFVVVPCAVYYASYYPYGKASGLSGFGMYFTREYLDIVIANQQFMFGYHTGLVSTHPYSSHWYQWLLDIRPILYYRSVYDDGTKSAFGAFVNPILCWGGLLAMLTMAWLGLARRDKKALFILIGYLSQLAPWMLVTRLTFEYHYFPCVVFLVLAICHVFDYIRRTRVPWRRYVYGFTAACLVLFIAYYPVLSGLRVPESYTKLLRWIPSMWPW